LQVVLEHTLLAQATFPVQSPSSQQPAVGMQLLPHSLKPCWHCVVEQVLLTHEKLPLQLLSSQQPFLAMHLPAQGFVSPAHDHWH
jgi:hypothetical protein